MKALFLRYTFPYVLGSLMFLCIWIASILTMDGWFPTISGITFFMYLIFMFPVMLYLDYRSAVKYITNEYKMYMNPATRSQVYANNTARVACHLGVPEFICTFAANAAIAKMEKTQPTKEIHGSH